MESKFTSRGFVRAAFKDSHNAACSLQESSEMRDDPAVWLGLDNPEAKILKPGEGWLPMPIPEDSEIFINGRMHLTQSQVRALLPALMHFAENGFLPDPDQHPKAG